MYITLFIRGIFKWKTFIITFDILGAPTCGPIFYDYPSQWNGGANGDFYIKFSVAVSTWKITVQFSSNVNSLSVWNGANSACAGSTCTFTDAGYNAVQGLGVSLTLGFQVKFILLSIFKFDCKPKFRKKTFS